MAEFASSFTHAYQPSPGGIVKNEDVNLSNFFRRDIKDKINSAIREVQKQLSVSKKKITPGKPKPEDYQGPPAPGTTTAPPTPTGSNGNLAPSQLKQVGVISNVDEYYPKSQKPNGSYWYSIGWGRAKAMLLISAADQFLAAAAQAKKEGITIPITSAYRSYEHQLAVIRNPSSYTPAAAGTSSHGDGIGLDIQDGTPGYNWMQKNGPKYGWHYQALPGARL